MTVSTTGAGFFNAGSDFGAANGSNGTITIDGGIYTATHGDVAINFYGSANNNVTGTLTLTNGAQLTVDPGVPGASAGVDVGGNFDTSKSVTGYLNILGGSSLELNGDPTYDPISQSYQGRFGNIHIGRFENGEGHVTVSGNGSELLLTGNLSRLNVGRDGGLGELTIEQGGFVGSQLLAIGWNLSSTPINTIGRVYVDGAGSELKASTVYGEFFGYLAGAAGYQTVGRGDGGRGYLHITNGGTVTVENEPGVSDNSILRLGRDNGSYGYGLVSGANSSLNVTSFGNYGIAPFGNGANLDIGQAGQGRMVVEQGGQVNVTGADASLRVGSGRSEQSPSAFQSTLEVLSGGVVLVDGMGEEDLGGVVSGQLIAGERAGTNGRIVIDGVGSNITVQNDLPDAIELSEFSVQVSIGHYGHGELYISNGGLLRLDGADDRFPQLNIGRGADDGTAVTSGIATVTGAGSAIEIYGSNMSGPSFGGALIVSRRANADGELHILNGGRVSNSPNNSTTSIGDDPGAEGLVIVDGAGSLLEAGTNLHVGVNGLVDRL